MPSEFNNTPRSGNADGASARQSESSAQSVSGSQSGRVVVAVSFGRLVTFMVLLSALGSFVNDMYLPSLPEMVRFFHTSVPMVQLGLTTGMAGMIAGQIIFGPVSDKYGRKVVLLWALGLFVVAAVVSVFSPTIHFFLVCRAIQGFGVSAAYFLARSIPADVYGGRQLAKTMAIVGAINGFAPASAPVIGGFISDWLSWKGVFVFLAVYAAAILCVSGRMKETLPPADRDKGPLLKAFGRYGALLRNRRFITHCLFKGTALGVLFAYISSAPFILQDHYGLSEVTFGLVMGFNAVFMAVGSMLALKFSTLRKAAWAGAICLMASMCCEAVALYCIHSFWVYELFIVPAVLSMGAIFTVTNTLSMNEGKEDAGSASAVLGVSGYIFGAIVAPLVGIGNILHSSAVVYVVMSALTLVMAVLSRRLTPDADMSRQPQNK